MYNSTLHQRHDSYRLEMERSWKLRNPERYYYYKHLTSFRLRESATPWHRFRRSPAYTLFMLTHADDIVRLIERHPNHWKRDYALDHQCITG